MLKRKPTKRKIVKRNPVKRKRRNPEVYNLIFSDKIIEKMTAKQAIQHIEVVSEYPSSVREHVEDPFAFMDTEEILEYVHNFANRWEYFH